MRTEEETGLRRSLRQRHMTMISLGGVIGAGLFVGSGAVMNQTGPAAFLSYLLAGALVVLVAGMVAVIVAMAFVDDVRSQLIPSFLSLGVVLAAAHLRYRQPAARRAPRGAQPSRT
jgi:hypothetical protein